MKKEHSILKSFSYAFEGIATSFKKGRNFRIQIFVAFVATLLGIYLNLSVVEWAVVVITSSIVLILELINTSLELVVDIASPEVRTEAKIAKDVAAGAVLVSSIASIIIGLLIFLPKLVNGI